MTKREGHRASTSASILDMLNEARAAGRRFSHTERVLHTSCEFWVATVDRRLERYLGAIPGIVLRDAEAAFAAIEIPRVADVLREARINPLLSASPVGLRRVVAGLQRALDSLEIPVDEMIRKFALEQTWSRLKRPTFQPIARPGASQVATSPA
jgi:hypothetical protein